MSKRENAAAVCGSTDCSLREALNAANAAAGANTIKFAANVTGTITLTLGELTITDAPLTITGPGARVLSLDANLASRVLAIGPIPSGSGSVNISGLT
jgi:CSLREA domain-containing protein